MTKTSAIFGVVSVLTVAIVGGVFIRQKIISDAFYWKAWAEFEENKRRNIRSVEEDIKEIDLRLKQETKNKTDTSKSIEKYKKDIQELEEEIKKYEERIQELKFPISFQKINTIDTILTKQGNLKSRINKLELEISKLTLEIDKFSNGRENNLSKKIKELTITLENKKKNLKDYAEYRINLNNKLEDYKDKNEMAIKNKKEIMQELENKKSLIFLLESLIKNLKETLNQKNNKLSFLKEQKF